MGLIFLVIVHFVVENVNAGQTSYFFCFFIFPVQKIGRLGLSQSKGKNVNFNVNHYQLSIGYNACLILCRSQPNTNESELYKVKKD